MQISLSAQPSNIPFGKDADNGAEQPWQGKDDPWKPLNCLVEAANRTKTVKLTIQKGSIAKTQKIHDCVGEGNTRKTKVPEHTNKPDVHDDKNGIIPTSSESIKTGRFHGTRRKRRAVSRGLSFSAQALLDAAVGIRERRIGPIWLSLMVSDDQ